jgi:hypothetical protein
MDGLLGTLQAHGLVRIRPADWSTMINRDPQMRRPTAFDVPEDKWCITQFGCALYDRVAAANEGKSLEFDDARE